MVKKHYKILQYVRKWVPGVHGTEDEDGGKVVKDFPLLVIDDEADNASVDTVRGQGGPDQDDRGSASS